MDWNEFERRQRRAAPAEDGAADLMLRVFTSKDGRALMEHLYAAYVDYRCRPGATEAELREAEAKRQVVYELEKLRDAAIENASRRAQAKDSA